MRVLLGLLAGIAVILIFPVRAQEPQLERQRVTEIHHRLLGLFTPVIYRKGEQKLTGHSGDVAFRGDCVDYYIAAHNQLERQGYVPHARFLKRRKDGEGHVVACVELDRTWCLDPNERALRSLGHLRREYLTVKVSRIE